MIKLLYTNSDGLMGITYIKYLHMMSDTPNAIMLYPDNLNHTIVVESENPDLLKIIYRDFFEKDKVNLQTICELHPGEITIRDYFNTPQDADNADYSYFDFNNEPIYDEYDETDSVYTNPFDDDNDISTDIISNLISQIGEYEGD